MAVYISTIAGRVAQTCHMLDSIQPAWYKYIDRTLFDMGNPAQCIVGQIFGNFFTADITRLGYAYNPKDARQERAQRMQFCYEHALAGEKSQYPTLTALYMNQITMRLQNKHLY